MVKVCAWKMIQMRGFLTSGIHKSQRTCLRAGTRSVLEEFFFPREAHAQAGGDGNVYVVWEDMRNGDADIYLSKSTDGGEVFGNDLKINDDNGDAGQYTPAIAVSQSSAIYVVWTVSFGQKSLKT